MTWARHLVVKISVASDQPLQNKVDKGVGYCRVRHCVQSILRLTEEWRLVTDAEGR